MRNNLRRATLVLALGGLLAAAPMVAFGDVPTPSVPGFPVTNTHLVRQVRNALLLVPFYGVFDNLEYRIDGNRVELLGQVVTPVMKVEAGNVVKSIKGVKSVINNIQVLPDSFFDDRIRFAEYRAIFGHYGLYRYAMGPNPAIHIIVDNGHVTLVGEVANQMDKTMAYMQARNVPGVFSVTNNLQVG